MRRHTDQTAEVMQLVPRSHISNLIILNQSPHLNSHFLQAVPRQAFSLVLPLVLGSCKEDWRNCMLQQLVVLHWQVSFSSLASHTSMFLCFWQLSFPAWPVQRPHLRQLPSLAVGKHGSHFYSTWFIYLMPCSHHHYHHHHYYYRKTP